MATTIDQAKQRLSPKGVKAVRELRTLQQQRDELDVKIKAHEATLKAELAKALTLGGKTIGTNARGIELVSLKSSIVRSINAALLRKINPELAEECTTESERRRLYLAPVPE